MWSRETKLALAFILGGSLITMAGCSKSTATKAEEPEKAQVSKDGEPEPKEEADGHQEEAERSAFSPEEILAMRCECDLPIYECAECRYEAGVVNVDRSLTGEDAREGILNLVQANLQRLEITVAVTGEIQLDENQTVHVTPRLSGVIRAVHANLGEEVQAGDPLFEFDSVELGEAVAEFEKNIALVALSEKNYQREKSLWDQRIGIEEDMLEAKGRLDEIQVALNAAEKRLHVMGLTDEGIASIRAEGHSSSSTLTVRAVQAGVVLSKEACVGEAVSGDREMMVISNLQSTWAWLDVSERDLEKVLKARQEGDVPVEIRVKAFPDQIFRGKLDHVGSVMSEETRTVKVRAIVENKDQVLRPGMFCEATLFLPSVGEALVVPKEAVLSDEGVDFVFRPLKDDTYYRVNVVKGRETSKGVEIVEGLANNDTLVGQGAFLLKSDVLRSKMGAGCAD